jgi:hypothetical protein
VAAAAAVVLVYARFFDRWSAEGLLALTGGGAVIAYALGARGGRPAEPRSDRSAMLLSSLVMLALGLASLTEVLGEDDALAGTSLVWAAGAVVAIAAATGVVFRSAACTFLAAAAAGALTIGVIATVIEPENEETFEWGAAIYFVITCGAGYLLRAFGERRHSPQLVAAAGVSLVAIGYSFGFFFFGFDEGGTYTTGRGLELLVVGGSLLVLAYGLLFRERGPAWAGVVALGVGVLMVDGKATLLVWPLALMGCALLLMLAAAVRSRAE